jgi:hypothetical protein
MPAIHVDGAFLATKGVLRHMYKDRGEGRPLHGLYARALRRRSGPHMCPQTLRALLGLSRTLAK